MVLSFHPKPVVPPPLRFMNVDIKNVVEHIHLGLTFTSNLKWSSHINNISIKANKRLTILNKSSFKITRKGLEQLYFAYIRSLLKYGDVVFLYAAQNDLNKLDKIHKRGAKIVAGGIRGVSSAVLFDELSWDTLPERRNNRKLFMFSDIVHHHTSTYLHELLPNSVHTRSGNRYNLRNADRLDNISCRTESFKSSFFPTSTAFWNNLDENLKSIDDRTSFKNSIVKKKPTKNKYYFLGPRTTNIIMARLRMRCSELNDHLYSLHVSGTNICSCGEVETTEHYFISCPLHTEARNDLIVSVLQLGLVFNCKTLLHGSDIQTPFINENLMKAIAIFLRSSGRFSLL